MRTLRLARELLDGHKLVKLEVLGDPKTLFPNVIETLRAAETLVREGFEVMVYTSDDPIVARQLEEMGCVAVMPLASLIGSGMGILNPWNLQIIIAEARSPGAGRCRRGHGIRCGHRDGTGMRRGADEYRHRRGERPGADGLRHAQGGRGRPRSVAGRTHAEEDSTRPHPARPTGGVIGTVDKAA